MKPCAIFALLIALSCTLAVPVVAQKPAATPPALLPDPLPRADAEQYFKKLEKLNPKLKEQNLFKRLEDAFGAQPTYPLRQVLSLEFAEVTIATTETKPPASNPIPREVARQYFKIFEALDSKRGGQNLFAKLQEAFTVTNFYAANQVLFIANPKAFMEKVEDDPDTNNIPIFRGAFSSNELSNYFAVLAEMDKAQKKPVIDRMATMTNRYGLRAMYLASEIREVEGNPDPNKKKIVTEQLSNAGSALDAQRRINTSRSPFWKGLSGFKIRKDWSDVVAGEDPSQTGRKSLDDLEGAKFSYSHDAQAKPHKGSTVADTWSVVGALIYPFTWRPPKFADSVTLAPSISVNKVSTQNPTNEVDHFDYRLGVVTDWKIPGWGLSEVQMRGAFVYGTDIRHDASLPAGELDLEPKFLWSQPRERGPQWSGLGYRNILIEKEPQKEDGSDDSLLDWQVRSWVHLEGGDLQRNGAKWETVDGSFFRIGPVVQVGINFPEFLRGFSINGQYSYLEPLSGLDDHKHFWKAGGSLTLYQNAALKHKISLVADYQEGGLTLSKQPVDIVTVGLGITY